MAKNIFSQMKEYVDKPKRNTFDLSFQNNLTMQLGYLYPVFCKEVIPGDSFQITPTFGLRFMPLNFPIQTRIQANLHFFYVRNRNLWKDWADFIGRTKEGLELPYIATQPKYVDGEWKLPNDWKILQTGKIGDHLGLPTTLIGDYGSTTRQDFSALLRSAGDQQFANWSWQTQYGDARNCLGVNLADVAGESLMPGYLYGIKTGKISGFFTGKFSAVMTGRGTPFTGSYPWYASNLYVLDDEGICKVAFSGLQADCFSLKVDDENGQQYDVDLTKVWTYGYSMYAFDGDSTYLNVGDLRTAGYESLEDVFEKIVGNNYSLVWFNNQGYDSTYPDQFIFNTNILNETNVGAGSSCRTASSLVLRNFNAGYKEVYDSPQGINPYRTGDVRVSALPFRAYESIYNAFYRNQQNDPFKIDGVPEYNKYLPNVEGGADYTDYQLYRRNWELDYLTSCVQSPQQGVAPLVGVTASGEFTFRPNEGEPFTATATIGEDGDTITGLRIQSPADQNTPDGKIQTGTLKAFNDMIIQNNGISISDFRNVNALQRWLETNMRRGFRYKDQLMSHFGVDAKYEELDMPEFIGGMSQPVYVNQVTQTTPTSSDPLGSYAGQANVLAQSKHKISHYCDEHGFIIGILSISPVPNYSQLVPKMFLKHDTLDYFFPEFGHIGMQPITYREVCPIQAKADGLKPDGTSDANLNEVFGYQRAWYDYLASIDEVHGLLRTELRNFVMNRQFDVKPELGEQFLKIDPEQLNDVFSVTDTTDKVVGQVLFEVTAKRPIPRFGIPRLE